MPRKNNNPKGIILILLAMMVFSVQDGIMKHIFSFVSLYEVYLIRTCLLYTSDAADDSLRVDLGGRRIIKKKCANTVIKKGVTKNKAVANPKGNTVNEI